MAINKDFVGAFYLYASALATGNGVDANFEEAAKYSKTTIDRKFSSEEDLYKYEKYVNVVNLIVLLNELLKFEKRFIDYSAKSEEQLTTKLIENKAKSADGQVKPKKLKTVKRIKSNSSLPDP